MNHTEYLKVLEEKVRSLEVETEKIKDKVEKLDKK